MISVGETARRIRESRNLTQREAARRLDVSFVHLCNVENDKSDPSAKFVGRYREVFGTDLYVLAWCEQGSADDLPAAVRTAAKELQATWKRAISQGRTF